MINELVKRYSALQSETEAIEAAADTLVSGFKMAKNYWFAATEAVALTASIW